MIWIVSDTHFNHLNIIKYANRPFQTIEEMNKTMINNWNKLISKTDIVYHLGDFALGLSDEDYKKLILKLNGEITLIRGNHDRIGKKKLINFGFKDVLKKIEIGNYILTHRPIKPKKLSNGKFNIHGHIHNHEYPECFHDISKHINVSVEVSNYKPICFCKLIEGGEK